MDSKPTQPATPRTNGKASTKNTSQEPTMTEKPTIYEAINRIMKDVDPVGKTERNEQQGFQYRGVDGVVKAVNPHLVKHGVVVAASRVLEYAYGTVEVGHKRTPQGHVRVIVEYEWHGPAGDTMTTVAPGEAMDSGDKATAKAMSVAYRTCLLQTLNIPTGDPDPDSYSYERSDATAEPAEEPQPWASEEQVAAYETALNAAKAIPDVDAVRVEALNAGWKYQQAQADRIKAAMEAAKARIAADAINDDAATSPPTDAEWAKIQGTAA